MSGGLQLPRLRPRPGVASPPSLRDWLPEDHLAWFLIDAVAEIDLSAFVSDYREDGWARPAFDPQMMVTLLLYGYAVGERSSARSDAKPPRWTRREPRPPVR